MTEENSRFIDRYKEITLKKLSEEKQAQNQEEANKRELKSAAAKEKRYKEKGTKARGNDRVDLWSLVEEKAESLTGANAASYNDFRQGMNEMWQACMVLSDALNFSYGELARATVGSAGQAIFYNARDGFRMKFLNSDPELPELQYKVSLEAGKNIQASFEKGEGLSDKELKPLFVSDIETWLESRGYPKDEGTNIYRNKVDGAELTKESLNELMADTSDKGLESWLKARYKGITINPAPEDDTPPSPSP